MDYTIRHIEQKDNAAIASVIRKTLEEFNANHPGTVYYEATTDTLFELFQKEKSVYYIAEINGEVVGGCGIYPTEGLPDDYCELVKLYLLPQARSLGIGKELMFKCFHFAQQNNYTKIYLESMPELTKALILYKKMGFKIIQQRLGNACHFGCQIKMLKDIS